jgi:hypothetical protein
MCNYTQLEKIMEVVFTIETTNGKVWKAVCSDPSLEVEGPDIISVSKSMATMIENWFTTTFNSTKKVIVEVPVIKARVKANISVRSEKGLDEFPSEDGETPIVHTAEKIPRTPPALPQPPSRVIDGPCKYISDGKGVYAVGMCEAVSDDPSDTPGLLVDNEGVCKGDYERCRFYCAAGTRVSPTQGAFESTQVEDDYMGVDEEEDGYGVDDEVEQWK